MGIMKRSDLAHHWKSIARLGCPAGFVALLLLIHTTLSTQASQPDLAYRVYHGFGLHWEALGSGAIWQIFSYALLHGGWAHLAINGLAIWLIGTRVETILGPIALLRVCLLGIFVGAIFHLLATIGHHHAPILVGTSAAVMALLLLLTTLSPESIMWPLPLRGRSLGTGLLSAEAILALIDPAIGIPWLAQIGQAIATRGGASCFEIAHACHFGGGLAGWFYGRWILRKRISKDGLHRARMRKEAKSPGACNPR